jgi:hypothetical protein
MEPSRPNDDDTVTKRGGRPSGHRTPRWVYAFIAVAVAGVLIVGALHLFGGGFAPHGL